MADLVQIKNPRTSLYVLVDRDNGEIVEHKEAPGPYEGIPMAKMRTIKDPIQAPGRITLEQAREAAKKIKARRTDAGEFAERFMRENPETFRRLADS